MKLMEKSRYRNLSGFLRETFGGRVHKVGLYGGFTCPNRDGTLGTGGCTFCNPASSRPGSYRDGMTVGEQLEAGCAYVGSRFGTDMFLPYFQDYTATWCEPSRLEELCRSVLGFPGVVGLSLCTRPDCLGDGILDVLEGLAREAFLWVEVGVQTGSDRLLEAMNRCHTAEDSEKAFERLGERGIHSSAHVILGYPGETGGDVLETARLVSGSGTLGVKVQNLHVVAGTGLAESFGRGEFTPPTLEDYAERTLLLLENIRPDIVVQRLSGEAPAALTVAPGWSRRKSSVIDAVRSLLESRDGWQGRALGFPLSALEEPVALHDRSHSCRFRVPNDQLEDGH
jgi:hypothetical protein